MLSFLIFASMFLVAFLAASLAVTFAWAATQSRLRAAGQEEDIEMESESIALIRGEEDSISTIRIWRALLARVSHSGRLQKLIAEANLDWTVGRTVLLMLMLALLTATVLGSAAWIPFPVTLIAALGVGSLPLAFIRFRRARRLAKFAAQFPEALDSIARALKAGHPLSSAMELLVYEQPEPIAGEIRRTREEWRLGNSWDDALDSLGERIPIPEVRLFSAAVKLQNRVGGRLNDVLGRMAETMREGGALEGEIRSITAHGRMTGAVLTALPIGICVVMFAANPEYMAGLFSNPMGKTAVTLAILANIAAHFLIRHLSKIKL